MRQYLLLSLTLSSLFLNYADASSSRDAFIDGLDSANCNLAPTELHLDTDAQSYDLANALSLSWISLTTLQASTADPSPFITKKDLADNWQITKIRTISNLAHNFKVVVADYQDTVLVTFHHSDDNQTGIWGSEPNPTLGQRNHDDYSTMLSSELNKKLSEELGQEWEELLDEVRSRLNNNQKLWVFGHSSGSALAQLSAAGFKSEGLHVNQDYLSSTMDKNHSSRSNDGHFCNLITALQSE